MRICPQLSTKRDKQGLLVFTYASTGGRPAGDAGKAQPQRYRNIPPRKDSLHKIPHAEARISGKVLGSPATLTHEQTGKAKNGMALMRKQFSF